MARPGRRFDFLDFTSLIAVVVLNMFALNEDSLAASALRPTPSKPRGRRVLLLGTAFRWQSTISKRPNGTIAAIIPAVRLVIECL